MVPSLTTEMVTNTWKIGMKEKLNLLLAHTTEGFGPEWAQHGPPDVVGIQLPTALPSLVNG